MTKREAVIKAIKHEYVAPIPYSLEMTEHMSQIISGYTADPDFYEHSGSYLAKISNKILTDLGGGFFRDMYGVVWDRRQEADVGVVHEYPIVKPEFGGFRFPEPDEPAIRKKCEYLLRQNDKFTIYNLGFSLFERAWTLHGMENVLCDFIAEPEFMEAMLDKIVEYDLGVIDIVSEYDIDCVFFGDDWGQQKGLIMGYPIWNSFLKPRLRKLYNHVKSKGMFVAQHSCGDCSELFPDLIELGLDIYNTFQPEIYDIARFKRLYGSAVTFYGGISTQRLLPFATPDGVKAEMHRIMDILADGGGYIIAPTHVMPADIPPENVLAFLEVCQNENPR